MLFKIIIIIKKMMFFFLEYLLLLPTQGFGPQAKTRGGTLGSPACENTYKKFQKSKKCVGSMGSLLDLMKIDVHVGLG